MKLKMKETMQNLTLISHVGIMMVVPIFAGVWLGNYVGEKLGAAGVGLIIGLVLGVGSAFRNLYVLAMQKTKTYENTETPEQYVKKFEKRHKR